MKQYASGIALLVIKLRRVFLQNQANRKENMFFSRHHISDKTILCGSND
jgi:hypothetical protein